MGCWMGCWDDEIDSLLLWIIPENSLRLASVRRKHGKLWMENMISPWKTHGTTSNSRRKCWRFDSKPIKDGRNPGN